MNMGDMHIRINKNARYDLEKLKHDIKRITGHDVSYGKAIEIFLCSPKVVILPSKKSKKRIEIKSLY